MTRGSLEEFDEVALVGKTHRVGNSLDRFGGLRQPTLRFECSCVSIRDSRAAPTSTGMMCDRAVGLAIFLTGDLYKAL